VVVLWREGAVVVALCWGRCGEMECCGEGALIIQLLSRYKSFETRPSPQILGALVWISMD